MRNEEVFGAAPRLAQLSPGRGVTFEVTFNRESCRESCGFYDDISIKSLLCYLSTLFPLISINRGIRENIERLIRLIRLF